MRHRRGRDSVREATSISEVSTEKRRTTRKASSFQSDQSIDNDDDEEPWSFKHYLLLTVVGKFLKSVLRFAAFNLNAFLC